MGKFDGVLIASDYDNTIVYTEDSLRGKGGIPPVSPENRAAMEYFMAQGGTFCVSTGRALPSFAALKDGIPMNGPTVLFNGAAVPLHRLSAGAHPGPRPAADGGNAGPDL